MTISDVLFRNGTRLLPRPEVPHIGPKEDETVSGNISNHQGCAGRIYTNSAALRNADLRCLSVFVLNFTTAIFTKKRGLEESTLVLL